MHPTSHPLRLLRALTLAVLLALALTTAASGGSTSVCGKKVIDDWYDNGRVDGTYAPRCYDDAIHALPRDVRDYSSAKEDITRALQARLRGEPAPPATSDPSPGDGTSGGSGDDGFGGTVTDEFPTDDSEEPGDDGGGTGGGSGPSDDGGVPEAIGTDVDTAASDAVPLPLLVLAGLALLLAVAGGLGYLVRRLQARRVAPARRVPPTA